MNENFASVPKLIGPRKIPQLARTFDLLGKKISLQLPDLQNGYAFAVEYADKDQLKMGRKRILMAASRIYGMGRVQTGSVDNVLYVWLKDNEIKVATTVRDHLLNRERELCNE